MNALRINATIDESVARAIPALRPLLGRRIELITLSPDTASSEPLARRLSLDELLAYRIVAPEGTRPLTEEDIERAIASPDPSSPH